MIARCANLMFTWYVHRILRPLTQSWMNASGSSGIALSVSMQVALPLAYAFGDNRSDNDFTTTAFESSFITQQLREIK